MCFLCVVNLMFCHMCFLVGVSLFVHCCCSLCVSCVSSVCLVYIALFASWLFLDYDCVRHVYVLSVCLDCLVLFFVYVVCIVCVIKLAPFVRSVLP